MSSGAYLFLEISTLGLFVLTMWHAWRRGGGGGRAQNNSSSNKMSEGRTSPRAKLGGDQAVQDYSKQIEREVGR